MPWPPNGYPRVARAPTRITPPAATIYTSAAGLAIPYWHNALNLRRNKGILACQARFNLVALGYRHAGHHPWRGGLTLRAPRPAAVPVEASCHRRFPAGE